MTEYVPDDHHGDGHDVVPHVDLPDHHGDDTLADHHPPPLDDLPSAHLPLPDELHFPGDEPAHDSAAHADLDPAAPWPDDAGFDDWLGGHDAPHDEGGDAELRDQLAAPAGEQEGLPSSDALVDWALRRLGDG